MNEQKKDNNNKNETVPPTPCLNYQVLQRGCGGVECEEESDIGPCDGRKNGKVRKDFENPCSIFFDDRSDAINFDPPPSVKLLKEKSP